MLRKIYIEISVVLFALITFYFLDFTNIPPNSFHRLAHIQLVPAMLPPNIGVLIVLTVLTLLFGRIYCFTIYPMGMWRDVIARTSKPMGKKKKRCRYNPTGSMLRWTVLGVATTAPVCGFSVVLGLLDPYSAYGRTMIHTSRPVYVLGNNLLESVSSRFNNYTFYQVDTPVLSPSPLLIAILTFATTLILTRRHGRTWCNTICPVGTVLGFLSRYSLFKVRIDTVKYNGYGLCATKCKAAYIHSRGHAVDYSRCVDCFDCLGACKQRTLVYAPTPKGQQYSSTTEKQPMATESSSIAADPSKHHFLLTGLAVAGAVPTLFIKAQESIVMMEGKKAYKKENPITPSGSVSQKRFQQHYTSCHLCVSKCPSHVLKPAFMEYDLGGVMQPTISFEKGFCNFDCTVCSGVCPNGAIPPLTIEQKHLIQMGYVVFIEENCIVLTDGTSYGTCPEHYPTQVIVMIPYKDGPTLPHVSTEIYVGCDDCEYAYLTRPLRTVYIEENPVREEAKSFEEPGEHKVEIDDSGF